MTVDNRFWKKKFEQYEQLFALYSQATNLPFLVCDPETFDDQVYVSAEERYIRDLAKNYADQKYRLLVVKIPKVQIQRFLTGLYSVGANAVMVQEGGLPVRVELQQLAPAPKPGDMMKGKIPKMNPQLQLTALYFLQELRRPVERETEEKKKLRSMEEEMAVNPVLFWRWMSARSKESGIPKTRARKPKSLLSKIRRETFFCPATQIWVSLKSSMRRTKTPGSACCPYPMRNCLNICSRSQKGSCSTLPAST